MHSDDELLYISALQHFIFCPRQTALIHIEQVWAENYLTAEGKQMHERVHERGDELRVDFKISRGLRLKSLKLGLVGQADVVEFHLEYPGTIQQLWRPFPVEYKRGKQKTDRADEVQLCAQAMCLEEMLDVEVYEGALFYGSSRRRKIIEFDQVLRDITEETSEKLHSLIKSGKTPAAIYDKKCLSCSLYTECMPKINKGQTVSKYVDKMISWDIE